ncbi:MAG: restriction endonuclease subunit S, partial [Bacteroidales bacterium]|nr:restriction endonuclease subunit S [Bacteroidales bacterium]
MNRYEEYKDSGIFWNPKIPKVWNVYRLGNVIQKENRPRPIDGELLVCTNKGTVIPRGEAKIGLIADSEDIYQGVSKGDLLIHGMDTWHGAIATSSMDGYCTPVVHVCTSKCNNVSFVKYYMRHMAFQKVFKIISNGVRQNTSDFRSWEKVRTIPIPLPPLPEQQAIVTYLDDKVGKIDACIEARKKEIDLLNETKKAIIADAVTHGLNPDAEMKDSGIPWIDQIPAHWEV